MVPNPLDLRGPEFLAFYALTAIVVLGLLYVARAAGEGGSAPRIDTADPYLIAYLRGGANEALRIATVALLDRGLLAAGESSGQVTARAKPDAVRRPIERALLEHFADPHLANTIFSHPALRAACDDYERTLTRLGLLPDAERRSARRRLLGVALLVLVGLSVAKIVVALGRGRSNVGFLIMLTIIVAVIAVKLASPRRTARGGALLADLRRLFTRLRDRAAHITPGGATADAALLAAVFGIAALPVPAFAYVRTLYPRAAGSGSTSSSCGSSGGSSCGGGGGGGGGGCGGCGGGGGD